MKRDDVDIIAEFLSSFAARARNEAIEECLKVVPSYSIGGCNSYTDAMRDASAQAKKAIRSLKSQEATDGK